MFLCRQDVGWTIGEKKKVLEELFNHDIVRLYNTIGSKLEHHPEATAFRNHYLLHGLMATANSGQIGKLQPVMDAIADPIVTMTTSLYAELLPNDKSPEYMDMEETLKNMQQEQLELESFVQLQRAKQNAHIVKLRRTMASMANAQSVERA